jgi:adenylosuccinate lyase
MYEGRDSSYTTHGTEIMIKRFSLPAMIDLWSLHSKFSHWQQVEFAILEAQARLGKITSEAVNTIKKHASFTVERIDHWEAQFDQDMIAFVHTNREAMMNAGVEAATADLFHKHHTSYDIEDPAVMLMLTKASEIISQSLRNLRDALYSKSAEFRYAVMIARTHVNFAEPSSFPHLLLNYADDFDRAHADLQRVVENDLRVGKMSGAVGTYAGLDPKEEEIACEILGLRPAKIATQILCRSRHARFMASLAAISGVIEKMAHTFEIMMHSCVHELQEPRLPKQRGSSAMPWKINPILVERLMGLPRMLRAYMMAAYENIRVLEWRDISQSSVERIIFPDATTLLHYMLEKATGLIKGLIIFPDWMTNNIERAQGVWAGQRLRYALTAKGVPDETAYLYVQSISFKAVKQQRHLREFLRTEQLPDQRGFTGANVLGDDAIEPLFDVMSYIQQGLEAIYDRFPCMTQSA